MPSRSRSGPAHLACTWMSNVMNGSPRASLTRSYSDMLAILADIL